MYGEVWFMQDGATCHTSRRSIALAQELFPNHLVSLRHDIYWPPRSPDLRSHGPIFFDIQTALKPLKNRKIDQIIFYDQVFLKDNVYSQKHNTSSDVKNAIEREVAAIAPSMLSKVRSALNIAFNLVSPVTVALYHI